MSFLKRVQHGCLQTHRTGHGFNNGCGLGGFVVDKAERYGAAAGWGYLKGYYREKAAFRGIGYDLIAGGLMVLGSAALSLSSNGHSTLAPHLERVGDAGVMSYINSIATSYATQHAGRSVMVLNEGKVQKAGLPGRKPSSVVGDIPPAPVGAYLTADEIAHFAQKR